MLFTINDKSPFMSRLDDWDDPMSTFALLGIIFGIILLVVLVETMPLMAAVVVLGLVLVCGGRPTAPMVRRKRHANGTRLQC